MKTVQSASHGEYVSSLESVLTDPSCHHGGRSFVVLGMLRSFEMEEEI
jgi:hypothetical protein